MTDWLSIEQLLATLVVTSLTCLGTLALWTAGTSRHWFVRIAATFALLSPLLAISAYGPFVVCWAAIGLVALGVKSYRLLRRRRDAKAVAENNDEIRHKKRWQFSVKSALSACTCVAVTAATVAKIPIDTWDTWQVMVIFSISVAIIILLAAWIVNGKGSLFERIGCTIAFPFALVAVIALVSRRPDWKIKSIDSTMSSCFSITGNKIIFFLAVAICFFIAHLITLLLIAVARRDDARSSFGTVCQNSAKLCLVPWSLLILAPPIVALFALAIPLPVIDNSLPNPNGFDDLVRIGKQFDNSDITKELSADEVNEAKLDAAVPKHAADFIALRKALELPFRIPVKYDPFADVDVESLMSLRQLARVLNAKAESSIRLGDVNEALNCWRDILRLIQSINQHALLIHFLIGTAIEGYATDGIYRTLPIMNYSQCKTLISFLIEFDRNQESFDNIRQREVVWMVKTGGWMNHLGYLLENLRSDGDLNQLERTIYQKDRAIIRLLLVETAIRAYQLDHGLPPKQLSDLVPAYLAALPDDPFSPDPLPFHYLTTNTGFKLWSIGSDGKNDGGARLPKNEYGVVNVAGNGDLSLDDYFARDEPANADTPNTGNRPAK